VNQSILSSVSWEFATSTAVTKPYTSPSRSVVGMTGPVDAWVDDGVAGTVDGGGACVVETTVVVTVITVGFVDGAGAEGEVVGALVAAIEFGATAGVPEAELLHPATSRHTPSAINTGTPNGVRTTSPLPDSVTGEPIVSRAATWDVATTGRKPSEGVQTMRATFPPAVGQQGGTNRLKGADMRFRRDARGYQ
jgi:hypothetical protein